MCPDDLYWQNETTPASRRFDDIYYSPEDGLEESRYVFLEGIGGTAAWEDKERFSIGETGFGTGLNFLLTVHEWLQTAPDDARLFYMSVEKFPLAPDDIRRAISRWPLLTDLLEELLSVYPEQMPGFHQCSLFDGRISLLLLFGDACEILDKAMPRPLDAWYLDGFAPRRNPDMWNEKLFSLLARYSRTGTRIATFTAAGFVRRGLENAGFIMRKASGFAQKRECLRGSYENDVTPPPPRYSVGEPWYRLPAPMPRGRHIAVLGAGIGGMMAGWHLQKAGYRVTVIDRRDKPMQETSGNPAAILDPFLSVDDGREGRFHRHALLQALRFYTALPKGIFHATGLERQAATEEEQKRLNRIMETTTLPPHLLQQRANGSLYFPALGYLVPEKLRDFLAGELEFRGDCEIGRLAHNANRWIIRDNNDSPLLETDVVVLCAPALIRRLEQSSHLPLEAISGQISLFSQPEDRPDHVLTRKGYIVPSVEFEGRPATLAGASFKHVADPETPLPLTDVEHAENRTRGARFLPSLEQAELIGGRRGVRWFCPDHLPLAGPAPVVDFYRREYEPIRHGPRHRPVPEALYHDNLYLLSAFGARGFLTAPLLATYLTALLTGDVPPLEKKTSQALHPGRFVIRDLVRSR